MIKDITTIKKESQMQKYERDKKMKKLQEKLLHKDLEYE